MIKKYTLWTLCLTLILILGNCKKKKLDLAFVNNVDKKFISKSDDIPTIVSRPIKDLNFNQAIIAKAYYEDIKDLDMVAKCGERILAIGSDQEIVRKTMLQLAAVNLELKNYEKAQKYAHDFQNFYPGSDQAKYAMFVDLNSTYLASGLPTNDQLNTKKTIELVQNFEKKYPEDVEYKEQIKQILEACYKKLILNELHVAQTYLDRFKYRTSSKSIAAAQKRLTYVKEKLLPKLNNQQDEVAQFELALNEAKTLLDVKNSDQKT